MEKRQIEIEAPTIAQKEDAGLYALLAEAGRGAPKIDLVSRLMGIGYKRQEAEQAADKFLAATNGKRLKAGTFRFLVASPFFLLGTILLLGTIGKLFQGKPVDPWFIALALGLLGSGIALVRSSR